MSIQHIIICIIVLSSCFVVNAQSTHYTLITTDSTIYEGTVDSSNAEYVFFRINNLTPKAFKRTNVASLNSSYKEKKQKPIYIPKKIQLRKVNYFANLGFNGFVFSPQMGAQFKLKRPLYSEISAGYTTNNIFGFYPFYKQPAKVRFFDIIGSMYLPMGKVSSVDPFIKIGGGYCLNLTKSHEFGHGDLISKRNGSHFGVDLGFQFYSRKSKRNWNICAAFIRKKVGFTYQGRILNDFFQPVSKQIDETYFMRQFLLKLGLIF